MTPGELIDRRKSLDFTQTEMANALGMSLRNYQNLESGSTAVKQTIELAIEHVAMIRACELRNPMLASQSTRKMSIEISKMMVGD